MQMTAGFFDLIERNVKKKKSNQANMKRVWRLRVWFGISEADRERKTTNEKTAEALKCDHGRGTLQTATNEAFDLTESPA